MNLAADAAAATVTEADLSLRAHWRVGLLLFAFALLVRLAFLPFATLDTGDTAARIWLGWLWKDDAFLITSGLWGPLHFYLIGAVLKVWPDPVWAPIAFHMAVGSLTSIVAYRLTLELFGRRRSAIAAGMIFAVYPAAIAVNLGARAETPFMLFLGLGLIGLARARRPEGRLSHAVFAGLAITLASMLRYEAWLLLPFLTLLLARRPKFAAVFLAAAMIHPVIWMVGNTAHFGNPLYSLMATSTWLQDIMAQEPKHGLLSGIGRIGTLIERIVVEMSAPVAVLIAAGIFRILRRRQVESVWLIPPLALFLFFAVGAFRDTMVIKSGYTTTFGLLLIPFVACSLEWLGVERWSRVRCAAGAAILIAAIGFFMFEPVLGRLPGGARLSADPVPSIHDEKSVRTLQALIERAELRRGEGALISDYFGMLATPYIAWQTRLHPRQICRNPGAANLSLTPEQLKVFLLSNRTGVLIMRSSSKLTEHLKLDSERSGSLAGIPLHLEPIGSMDWEHQKAARDFGTLTVSRYRVVGMDDIPPRAPLRCTISCPISFCR